VPVELITAKTSTLSSKTGDRQFHRWPLTIANVPVSPKEGATMTIANAPATAPATSRGQGFNFYLVGCALVAALGDCCSAFDTAVISGTTDLLQSIFKLSDNLLASPWPAR